MACASFFPEEKERPFVDREEFIQAFYNALETIKGKEAKILVYHGVAGIGKTRLRREISKIIEKYNDSNRNFRIYNESNSNFHILCATVDFETEEFRQSDKFLEILRDQFQGEYGIKFHTFDFAHALYWKKVNPRITLCKENDSEDNIFTHLLDIGDDLSNIGGIFNPVNVSIKMAKLIKRLPASYREWELKNRNEISRLISMEAAEIRRQLYLYWAYDLREYLQRNSESAVIFIDSYEALWGNDRSLASLSSKDEWLRKEIQTLLSSSCLWILCGQESPRWVEDSNTEKAIWGNSIERHEIKGLPEEHARNLLKHSDVLENNIQTAIINGSEGVPYYLDLSIDHIPWIPIGCRIPKKAKYIIEKVEEKSGNFYYLGARRVTVCHEAAEKMRADPSDSLYRKRFQTTHKLLWSKATVVSVMGKGEAVTSSGVS